MARVVVLTLLCAPQVHPFLDPSCCRRDGIQSAKYHEVDSRPFVNRRRQRHHERAVATRQTASIHRTQPPPQLQNKNVSSIYLPRSVKLISHSYDDLLPTQIIKSRLPVLPVEHDPDFLPIENDDDLSSSWAENFADSPPDWMSDLSVSARNKLERISDLSDHQRAQLAQKIKIEAQAHRQLDPNQSLRILYHDDCICVAVKPGNVLSVPGSRRNPSLANLVYDYLRPPAVDLDQMVVHRLDMATSGVIVYAQTLEALRRLHADFKERRVIKTYEALVHGHLDESIAEGEIDVFMERDPENPPFMRVARPREDGEERPTHKFWTPNLKSSLTTFAVISREYYQSSTIESPIPVTRLELRPHTGRTHQLRVHCASGLRSPIVGDIYHPDGIGVEGGNLLLHAKRLSIHHPLTQAPMMFECPAPF